ncbi:hypothetical protein [Granulicella tundricola]|uniref:FlgN family protein n=1 Tax=Granulicella tundricola (strain ATCC BAA-1859 / DSM 23138 / MP5ACTX9) TaxID=1198114 RepID=E8X616_GRATM|nr:hypothetical protein [Granulicella tundricola]ADW70900.1 hypothetical protein AciX9_4120 [Granulicella tundricola MP5ACTX9]
MQTALTQSQIQSVVTTLSPLEAQEYLESIQALTHELDRAMEAIVSRELPAFEQSVSRQMSACVKLAELPKRSARRVRDVSSEAAPDAELTGRIAAASVALVALNKRYSALLKHSGDTLRMFAGLFRSYTGTTQPGMLSTWSCEL